MKELAPGIWKITLGEPEKLTPVTMSRLVETMHNSSETVNNLSDHMNNVVLSELSIDENLPTMLPYYGEPIFDETQMKYKVTKRGLVLELPLSLEEEVYGFGLQLKSFSQIGKKKQLRTNADPVADSGDTHAPVPFYVSTKGYGVFVDTARYVSFYCGSSVKLKQEHAVTQPQGNYKIKTTTEELYQFQNNNCDRSMVIDIPSVNGVDIYLFAGPDMKTAVQRYNLFSGGGCIPPMWGLGVWYRGYGKMNEEDVLLLAAKIREDKIPCDVFGLEPGWQSHSYSCSYAWDPQRFRNQEELIKKMSLMNYKLNLWEHAFVHPTSPIYDKLKDLSGDYEVWNGLVPDFLLKEARDVFAGYHKVELIDKGISGFKLDECDSSDFTGGWSFPNCAEFPSGLDGEQMHSMIGKLYQETLYSIYKNSNTRTYNEVRSSHALAASLPFVLYSDLYDHGDFIRGVVNSGFSGILWSPEVRQCDSDKDLIRRIQTVVFSPQTLVNAWMIPNPPWFNYDITKNLLGEKAEDSEQISHLVKTFFELRMSFIPYIYAAFARYHYEGVPPFRALVMDYPEDTKTYHICDEYMMGDSVLVAPVTASEDKRKVYLPTGNWYSFWTNDKYEGGNEYEFEVPLDKIPLFIKEGSMLPLAKPVECITPDTIFDVTVNCYGDTCVDFILFEDDGNSFNFMQGDFNRLILKKTKDGISEIREGAYPGRKYNIIG
ncbi:MAG: glycoside hydrolase [Herbinix sp.]|jgi:alpha-D-xyloside xylohydrolase|nr:glycoside hydrolase [Herbinix sp.]